MKEIFSKGDKKTITKKVQESDFAVFETGLLHKVCSTFSLAQAIEWSSRLFVLDMKDEDEEGVGTSLTIYHKSPAFLGDEVKITATYEGFEGKELICSYEAKAGERLIATGKTGQKILKKDRLKELFKQS